MRLGPGLTRFVLDRAALRGAGRALRARVTALTQAAKRLRRHGCLQAMAWLPLLP